MILAIDIGATKTLLAVFDHSGVVKSHHKFSTPSRQSSFVKQLVAEIGHLQIQGLSAIAVAAPAAINYGTKTITYTPNLPWRNFKLVNQLAKIYKVPITIDNDCNLAALSEARWGSGRRFKSVLYTTISTGVGTGFVVNHQIPHPLQRMEAGRMYASRQEPTIWEDVLSGPAIIKRFGIPAWEIRDQKQWDAYAKDLALYLLSLITAFGPDVVVIGGGVANHLPKFRTNLNRQLSKYKSPLLYPLPPIRQARHVETAVIYGCYLAAKTATIDKR